MKEDQKTLLLVRWCIEINIWVVNLKVVGLIPKKGQIKNHEGPSHTKLEYSVRIDLICQNNWQTE